MCEILHKHGTQSGNTLKRGNQTFDSLTGNSRYADLKKEYDDKNRLLRQMRGEDLQGLTMEELMNLERTIDVGLTRVMERKGRRIMEHLSTLQQKEMQLQDKNKWLKEKMEELRLFEKQALTDHGSVNGFHEESQYSSESVPQHHDLTADTSLKLGLS